MALILSQLMGRYHHPPPHHHHSSSSTSASQSSAEDLRGWERPWHLQWWLWWGWLAAVMMMIMMMPAMIYPTFTPASTSSVVSSAFDTSHAPQLPPPPPAKRLVDALFSLSPIYFHPDQFIFTKSNLFSFRTIWSARNRLCLKQSVTNILKYSNIRIFLIRIYIRTFVRINFLIRIYSDIRSYHFLDTNIFG